MVKPVILTETGQSYEAANIQRWLEVNSICPVTKKKLISKQMVPNYALMSIIGQWAEGTGVRLPRAPVHKPIIPASAALAAAGGSGRAGLSASDAPRTLAPLESNSNTTAACGFPGVPAAARRGGEASALPALAAVEVVGFGREVSSRSHTASLTALGDVVEPLDTTSNKTPAISENPPATGGPESHIAIGHCYCRGQST
jgi:hypothetical protein